MRLPIARYWALEQKEAPMTASESSEAKTQPKPQPKSHMTAMRQWFGSLARWQKGCLAAASLFLILGLVASIVEEPAPPKSMQEGGSAQSTGGSSGPSSLVSGPGQPEKPGAKGKNGSQQGAGADPWSAGFFRLATSLRRPHTMTPPHSRFQDS
jgi:hypothetical protein